MAAIIEATIIEFPKDAAQRLRLQAPGEGGATVLILPSIRIERHEDVDGPAQGAGRGRPRRARS